MKATTFTTLTGAGSLARGAEAGPADFSSRLNVHWLLWLGLACLAAPTLFKVMSVSWSTPQGGHGPIVLATGIWLVVRKRHAVLGMMQPGSFGITIGAFVPAILAYCIARITGLIEIEGLAMYAALIAALYYVVGWRALKLLWFPIVYLLFIFPPPDSLVAFLTQPIKILISQAAVDSLYALGYPIAASGVTIQVAQYQLLVAAACAGLNSMISLIAIGLFYVYILHNANWRYAALLTLAIIPVAMLANFVRVIALILVTYHFGDSAAQGFVHNFAGILMFAVSLAGFFVVDALGAPIRRRLDRSGS